MGMCCSNVYGKIAAAPLIILSSVYICIYLINRHIGYIHVPAKSLYS